MQFRRSWRFWIVLLGLLLAAAPASAQTTARVELLFPDTEAFPEIRLFLDVHKANGAFAHNLDLDDLRLYENGSLVQVDQFFELRPGLQLVVAVNPGEAFGIRNTQGSSRYDRVLQALSDWAEARQGSTLDDIVLLTPGGAGSAHGPDARGMLEALRQTRLNLDDPAPTLDVLFQSVERASDSTSRQGMERAVLFITALPDGDPALSIESLLSLAAQQHVRIYTWLVASPDAFELPGALELRRLSEQSQGQFYAFSDLEELPDPESYFMYLRDIYELVYQSALRQGGTHQLVAELVLPDGMLSSPARSFNLALEPPNPVFLVPPAEITLRPLSPQMGSTGLEPSQQVLQVLVDFPDGRLRPLARTALYVDGQLVEEKNSPPYDRFTWDLSPYSRSGQHVLQVEVVDTLGLAGKSIETVVDLTVVQPAANPWIGLLTNIPLVVGLSSLLLVALFTLALILAGRISPQTLRIPLGSRRRSRPAEPLPAAAGGERRLRSISPGRIAGWVNRLNWPQRRLAPRANAFLLPITGDVEEAPVVPIPITVEEATLGQDPSQATLVLDEPSVQALHARLVRSEEGGYRLSDEGSVAGTWVNYLPVPKEGVLLEHGDLIHIGRVCFRFQLRQPVRARTLTVTILEQKS